MTLPWLSNVLFCSNLARFYQWIGLDRIHLKRYLILFIIYVIDITAPLPAISPVIIKF